MDNLIFEELTDQEKKIIEIARTDPIPHVSEKEIYAAAQKATSFYVEKQSFFDRNFWCVVLSCLSDLSSVFWLAASFLLGSCVFLNLITANYEISPIAYMTALAPIPIIVLSIRELQYRDPNLSDLEKACKYNPTRIYTARLWIGMIINIIIVSMIGAISFRGYSFAFQMFSCAFIALFLIGAFTLFIMSVSDSPLPLSLVLGGWVLLSICLLSLPDVQVMMESITNGAFIASLFISIILFIVSTMKVPAKKYA